MPEPTPAAIATSTVPDWEEVRRRAARPGWAAATLQAVREDFDHWRARLRLPGPEHPSAWSHHYFCEDGTGLRFDPDRPLEHVCPTCGRVYRGEPWDGGWRTRMHHVAVAQTQRAALLARLAPGEQQRSEALTVLGGIVTHYAAGYGRYELHGANVGKGRVMPQNLDESIWAIGLLRSVRWAGPLLPEAVRDAARRLAGEVASVLEPQLGMIHNIHCWIVAALAECAVATGDRDLLATATDGPFGARRQILEGMHPEGLWFEINPHYHFYTVDALLSFVEVAGPAALSGEPAERLLRAVRAPAELAYSDGRIPAYGDGWPDTFLSTFAQSAEVAARLLGVEAPGLVAPYLDDRSAGVELWFGAGHVVAGESAPRPGRRSVGALVFGADPLPTPDRQEPSTSVVWPGPGIAVLRGPATRVAMRFGPDAGWHDHHDKLAVDVECGRWRSLDLGTTGYGSDLTVWMRSPVAHNLLVVDEQPQPRHAGELVAADEVSVRARATWNGAQVTRSLRLTATGWDDELQIQAVPGTPLEWVFHGDGAVVLGSGAPRTGAGPGDVLHLPEDELGHGWLSEVRSVPMDQDGVTLTWDHPDAPRLQLTLPRGWTVFRAEAPANPSGATRGLVGARGPAQAVTRVVATFTRVD